MKITIGEVVAGAAAAAGGVLLLGAAFPESSLSGTFNAIGDWIGEMFGKVSNIDSSELGKWASSHPDTVKAVSGAALLGGGYALHNSMQDKKREARDAELDAAADRPVEGGFAEQIAMDRAMMRARAAMVQQTPEFAGLGR
jgi:hypothetical protein